MRTSRCVKPRAAGRSVRLRVLIGFALIVAALACYALLTLSFSSPRYRWLGSAARSALTGAAESLRSAVYRDYIWK